MSMSVQALVLAAGKGTRMRSGKPKMLHALLGLPLPLNRLGVVTPSARVWLAGALWVLGASTFAFFTPWLRSRATRDERVVLEFAPLGEGSDREPEQLAFDTSGFVQMELMGPEVDEGA